MLFYNYFNPIYEDVDESGLVEDNYEYEYDDHDESKNGLDERL
jgi:hypothetical protein